MRLIGPSWEYTAGYAHHTGPPKGSSFKTAPHSEVNMQTCGRVSVHPSSVNYKDKERPFPWIVFQEQV
eukprot:1773195-Pyramimonas_sp.AAC.1